VIVPRSGLFTNTFSAGNYKVSVGSYDFYIGIPDDTNTYSLPDLATNGLLIYTYTNPAASGFPLTEDTDAGNYALTNLGSLQVTGAVTAESFVGDGSLLTGIVASSTNDLPSYALTNNQSTAVTLADDLTVGGTITGNAGGVTNVPNVLNIEDFGAVAGDANDDSTAIQAALDAVPVGGGIVFIPKGIFKVNATVSIVQHGTIIQGQGASGGVTSSCLQANGNLDVIRNRTNWFCEIKDLTIYNNDADKTAVTNAAIRIQADSEASTSGSRASFANLRIYGFKYGIVVNHATGVTFKNVDARDNVHSFWNPKIDAAVYQSCFGGLGLTGSYNFGAMTNESTAWYFGINGAGYYCLSVQLIGCESSKAATNIVALYGNIGIRAHNAESIGNYFLYVGANTIGVTVENSLIAGMTGTAATCDLIVCAAGAAPKLHVTQSALNPSTGNKSIAISESGTAVPFVRGYYSATVTNANGGAEFTLGEAALHNRDSVPTFTGVVTGDGSGLTNSNGATNNYQFVTLEQLQTYAAGNEVYYFDVGSNVASIAMSGTVRSTNNASTALPSLSTNTVSTVAVDDYFAFVTEDEFTYLSSGLATIELYCYRSGTPDLLSVKAEVYVLTNGVEAYEFEPSSAAQVITATLTKYTFSVPITDYNDTDGFQLAVKLKATSQTSDPSFSIVSGGAYPSHVSFSLPGTSYVRNTATITNNAATATLAADLADFATGTNTTLADPSIFVAADYSVPDQGFLYAAADGAVSRTTEGGYLVGVHAASVSGTLTNPISGTITNPIVNSVSNYMAELGIGDMTIDTLEAGSLDYENGSTNALLATADNSTIVTNISTSAAIAQRLSDETGTGALVFAGGNIGAATATTPAEDDNDTSVATTAYVQTEIAGLAGGDASAWATFDASTNVDFAGFYATNIVTIYAGSVNLSGALDSTDGASFAQSVSAADAAATNDLVTLLQYSLGSVTTATNLAGGALGTPSSGNLTNCTNYAASALVKFPVDMGFALSGETNAVYTGTNFTCYLPFAFTITNSYADVRTAPTGADLQVVLKQEGAIVFTNTIAASALKSTNTTFVSSSMTNRALIEVNVQQVGSTVAGAGLKLWLQGYR
jgi:hypothetical protein